MSLFLPRLGISLQASLLQIVGYRSLLVEVEKLRREPYDCENSEHEDMLLKVKYTSKHLISPLLSVDDTSKHLLSPLLSADYTSKHPLSPVLSILLSYCKESTHQNTCYYHNSVFRAGKNVAGLSHRWCFQLQQ